MKRSVLALAVPMLALAVSVSARPVSNFGGCGYNTLLQPGHVYGQTFKPTFSVLNKVRFVLFEDEASSEDTLFQMVLKSQGGSIISASDYGVLTAGTSYDDAASGDAVIFTFPSAARVTPGQTYELELVRIGGTSPIRACMTFQSYPDGVLLYDGAYNMDWDFEFGLKGGGRAK